MPYQFVQRAVDPDMPQMVGLGGLEPPTLPLSGVRSNHLSYRPIPICRDIGLPGRVSTRRVRYMPGLASRRCRRRAFPGPQKRGRRDPGLSSWCRSNWWSQSGSNRRPPACKAGALPAELIPQSRCKSGSIPTRTWWVWLDSNQRPPPYQDGALTD